ncbi:MFS transporter [Burkholderia sp. Bp9017]|uniref:MFS transporter n=1 Tax=Burkholderia TaxID=32008 RepID=UPI000F5DEF8B|nr:MULTISPECIES: glycoside-pentoside-hexuronide (GPH):cation symporter [Burkholderia]MBY4867344.1 glycoside-pentoside-hexuronide (GPH):cation symporter [Burkholderia anthina]RQZ29044.1 MFS transporter [Burkholderia sp. Bp9017]RQZ35805.1 MFS transporter [Burkholderia sp. Bp9016]
MTAAHSDSVALPDSTTPAATRPESKARLALRTRLAFGMGDFGLNLYWQATTLYLLYYYTDVVGLSPVTAGWIFSGAVLWDALCDPVVGYVANRTRTRWGRYRPYLLYGCVPLAVSFVAMFVPAGMAGGIGLTAFVLGTHVLFRTAYTVLSMPYDSLMATLTDDSRERGSLAAYRMICASTAGVVVALSMLKLVHVFGPTDERHGFLVVAIVYAAASLPVLLFTFCCTAERIGADAHPISVREAFAAVSRNRAFLLICGMSIALFAASTVMSKMLPYLLKYVLHREDLIGTALGVVALQAFVAIPFWAWIMRRTSKRRVALLGCGFTIAGNAMLGALGLQGIGVPSFLVALGVIGFGTAATSLSLWAMIPDTVEYGQWRTGVRGEGTLFGVVAFVRKAALAIAVAGIGHVLGAIGFVANQPQSKAAIDGMWALQWQGPAVLLGIAALFAYCYPVSPDLHGKIVRDLHARRTHPSA